MSSPTAAVLGEIGLPVPIRELAAKTWDVIVVGAGHNGLACAAYLARAGQRVLVIESRARVGGACTIEEPFPGVRMSPCAYLAGLLHPLVLEELELPRRGYVWTPAVNGLFVPFLDGSSIQLWDDDDRCAEEVRALAPGDVEGWRAMSDVIRRLRDALRPAGARRPAGSATRPRASKSKTASATTPKRAPSSSTGRWPSLSSTTSPTSACRSPISARALSAPTPAPSIPARLPSASITPPAGWAECPACGAMCAAAWAWFRSTSAMPRAKPARPSCPGVPVAQILPGEGVVARRRRTHRRAHHRLQCRPAPDAAPARRQQPIQHGASRSSVFPSKAAPSSSTSTCANCPTLPRAPASINHTTTARSTPRSPKKSGRQASPPRAVASCPSICGASFISKASTTRRSSLPASTP